MVLPPADDGARPVATDARAADAEWIAAAWEHLLAKPEFSIRPQPWRLPLGPAAGASCDPAPLQIVVCGMSSDFGNGLLLQLLRLGHRPVALVTSTRLHATATETFFAQAAAALGIPFLALPDINAPEAVERLRALRPDAMLVFSFDQIFRPAVVSLPRIGSVNFHPSLLPRYRGPEPLYWQVLCAEQESGLTAHLITDRIDAGPVLAQNRVRVAPAESAGSLARRLVLESERLLARVLDLLSTGRLAGLPPDVKTGSYQHAAQSVALDWSRSAAELERLVRAGRPDFPPYLEWRGHRYHVLEARVVPGDAPAGTIVAVTPAGPVVATNAECLLLANMVPENQGDADASASVLRSAERLPGAL